MENTSPLSLDPNHRDHSPEEIVDALQTIVSDADAFLSNWFRRLEQCVESCDPRTTPEAILQKRLDDFQNEKNLWEAKRKSDERAIQEKAEQLTEAWLRLEQEQRRFLQMNDPQRHAGSERGSTNGVASRPAQEDSPAASDVEAAFAEPSPSGDARPTHQPESFPNAPARDSAVRQFQQLRREIESSRPNVDRSRGTSDRVHPFSGDRP